jgi:hypothetical protein
MRGVCIISTSESAQYDCDRMRAYQSFSLILASETRGLEDSRPRAKSDQRPNPSPIGPNYTSANLLYGSGIGGCYEKTLSGALFYEHDAITSTNIRIARAEDVVQAIQDYVSATFNSTDVNLPVVVRRK